MLALVVELLAAAAHGGSVAPARKLMELPMGTIIPVTKSLLPSSSDSIIDMETKDLIQKEIEVFPEPYLEEVLDFIHFLKEKASKNRMETAILSESCSQRIG